MSSLHRQETSSIHASNIFYPGDRPEPRRKYEGVWDDPLKFFRWAAEHQDRRVSVETPFRVKAADLGLAIVEDGAEFIIPSITGEVVIKGSDVHRDEFVRLRIGERELMVPRHTGMRPDGLLSVSTYDSIQKDPRVDTLNFPLFGYEGSIYDRGMVWIRAGEKPTIHYVIEPNHDKKPSELLGNHLGMINETTRQLGDLLAQGPF